MEVTIRALTENDKIQALRVEAAAMPKNRYLSDVWELFIGKADGCLLGAFIKDTLVGLGKITRLYEHYGWLETLRVHPDCQRVGR